MSWLDSGKNSHCLYIAPPGEQFNFETVSNKRHLANVTYCAHIYNYTVTKLCYILRTSHGVYVIHERSVTHGEIRIVAATSTTK